MFQPFYHPLRQALINYSFAQVSKTFIKSLQMSVGIIADGEELADIEISSVDLSFTAPILLGFSSPNADPRNCFCSSYFLDATHLRLRRCYTPTIGPLFASFCILEFDPDFVFSLQNVSIEIPTVETVATLDISEVNLDKSVIFPCGKILFGDQNHTIINAYVEFLNSTTLQATRTASGCILQKRVCVMEFI